MYIHINLYFVYIYIFKYIHPIFIYGQFSDIFRTRISHLFLAAGFLKSAISTEARPVGPLGVSVNVFQRNPLQMERNCWFCIYVYIYKYLFTHVIYTYIYIYIYICAWNICKCIYIYIHV